MNILEGVVRKQSLSRQHNGLSLSLSLSLSGKWIWWELTTSNLRTKTIRIYCSLFIDTTIEERHIMHGFFPGRGISSLKYISIKTLCFHCPQRSLNYLAF